MNYENFFDALTELVTGMCGHPESLRVFTEDHDGVQTLVVMPHTADHARLVGRRGETVNAFQFLTGRAGVRFNQRIAFNLGESYIGEPEPREPFAFNPDFDRTKFERLLGIVLESVADPAPDYHVAYTGQGVLVEINLPRQNDHACLVSAVNSVFMPYCYHQGRASRIRLGDRTNYENHTKNVRSS